MLVGVVVTIIPIYLCIIIQTFCYSVQFDFLKDTIKLPFQISSNSKEKTDFMHDKHWSPEAIIEQLSAFFLFLSFFLGSRQRRWHIAFPPVHPPLF